MHPYCTHKDILDRMAVEELIRLTTTGVGSLTGLTEVQKEALVNWDTVDASIERSDNKIDAYASGKVVLPLNPVSGLAALISADLTVCDIWAIRPHSTRSRGASSQSAVDAVTEKCRAAQKMLEQIMRGDLDISPSPVAVSDTTVTYSAAPRAFSRDKMRGY